jgi:hypothetical protein
VFIRCALILLTGTFLISSAALAGTLTAEQTEIFRKVHGGQVVTEDMHRRFWAQFSEQDRAAAQRGATTESHFALIDQLYGAYAWSLYESEQTKKANQDCGAGSGEKQAPLDSCRGSAVLAEQVCRTGSEPRISFARRATIGHRSPLEPFQSCEPSASSGWQRGCPIQSRLGRHAPHVAIPANAAGVEMAVPLGRALRPAAQLRELVHCAADRRHGIRGRALQHWSRREQGNVAPARSPFWSRGDRRSPLRYSYQPQLGRAPLARLSLSASTYP